MHYRCVQVYITETDSTRITDTITWIPENTGIPTLAPSDKVIMAIRGLQETIKGVPKDNELADRADEKIIALQHLTELFAKSEANAREMRVTEPFTNAIPTLTETATNETRIPVGLDTNAREMRVDSTAATPFTLQPNCTAANTDRTNCTTQGTTTRTDHIQGNDGRTRGQIPAHPKKEAHPSQAARGSRNTRMPRNAIECKQ
jgi:hypothetical protein